MSTKKNGHKRTKNQPYTKKQQPTAKIGDEEYDMQFSADKVADICIWLSNPRWLKALPNVLLMRLLVAARNGLGAEIKRRAEHK